MTRIRSKSGSRRRGNQSVGGRGVADFAGAGAFSSSPPPAPESDGELTGEQRMANRSAQMQPATAAAGAPPTLLELCAASVCGLTAALIARIIRIASSPPPVGNSGATLVSLRATMTALLDLHDCGAWLAHGAAMERLAAPLARAAAALLTQSRAHSGRGSLRSNADDRARALALCLLGLLGVAHFARRAEAARLGAAPPAPPLDARALSPIESGATALAPCCDVAFAALHAALTDLGVKRLALRAPRWRIGSGPRTPRLQRPRPRRRSRARPSPTT